MIKANELRVGNILDYHGVDVIVLDVCRNRATFGYFTDSFGFERKYDDDYFPKQKPLNEERLKRFGFYKAGSYWKHKDCSVIQVWVWEGSYNFTVKGNNRIVGNTVHALQNLYFALTGKELTIKE